MADLNELSQFGKLYRFEAGQYLFQQGDTGANMYIILKGKVTVSLESAIGEPIKVAEMLPGNFVGEMSVLEKLPRSATVQAAVETIALSIDQDHFLDFINSKPDWAFRVMQSLSSRVRKINEKLSSSQMNEEDIQKGLEKASIRKNEPAEGLESPLFPEGHGSYQAEAPEAHGVYLYDKNVTCPVCDHGFSVRAIRTSRLRLVKTTQDFREIHEGFDKLWHQVWSCPSCYYSAFYSDFNEIDNRTKDKLYPLLLDFQKGQKLAVDNMSPDIQQVFLRHYLALNTRTLMKKMDYKVCRLWISLAWLYQDMEDEKMFRMAYHTAKEAYMHVMMHSRTDLPNQELQRLYMLIAEITLFEGDAPEALKLFQKAVMVDQKTGLAGQARDRMYDIKNPAPDARAEEEGKTE